MPSSTYSLKYSGEHHAASLYSEKYKIKNINSIQHLLSEQKNSLGIWGSDLRSYKKYKNSRYDGGENQKSPQKI